MSKIRFSMFRTLTEKMVDSAEITFGNFAFSYIDSNGIQKNVIKKEDSDPEHIELPGKGCDWDPDSHNLMIHRGCTISNPQRLFDHDTGITNIDSVLGIAIVISSKDSSQRTVFEYTGEIVNKQNAITLSFDANLPAQTYRRCIDLKTILYLKRKSNSPNAPYYANIEGAVLGTLPESQIFIEEQSPEFPTRVIKLSPREPLWKLEISWDDPRIESFKDTVRLIINESYPGYNEIWGINADERKKNALKIEIYSSAMILVIQELKNNEQFWNDTIKPNLDTVEDGSVSDDLCYLLNVVIGNYNLDSNELSMAIRKKLGERR